ncbi:MAG: DUF4961 domain-containing protein [Saprospiraceae bacterium]|nr:DUF4961 domain-containing protein [Saprospiraceae bacterium]
MFLSISSFTVAQITLNPTGAAAEDAATLTFDASLGNKELLGATKVYMHHGVVTDNISGIQWKYVKGNWGKDDGIGEMTKVSGEANKWQITFNPNIRAYFGVPAGTNIFRISCVFRNVDGTKKGTLNQGDYGWGSVASNGDIYINLNNDNYIGFKSPAGDEGFFEQGQEISIQGEASSAVSNMKLWLDEGAGYVEKVAVTTGTTIDYSYVPSNSLNLGIKLTAIVNGVNLRQLRNTTLSLKKHPLLHHFLWV